MRTTVNPEVGFKVKRDRAALAAVVVGAAANGSATVSSRTTLIGNTNGFPLGLLPGTLTLFVVAVNLALSASNHSASSGSNKTRSRASSNRSTQGGAVNAYFDCGR
jgi:hypothetical protein